MSLSNRLAILMIATLGIVSSHSDSAFAQKGPRSPAPEGSETDADPQPLNRCTVRVSGAETSAVRWRRARSFAAREVVDLRFDFWLLAARSSEPAEVRVYAPGDRLYKVLRVSASPGAASSVVRRGLLRRGLSILSVDMPLVGTHVTSRSLYGEWKVEGWFVGAEKPCSRSVEFELSP